ncbi:cytochrome c assembly protein [Deinococcus maricopensis DSM 21211]|uniref:Cytochrome c assembly protein n=2 Tax=Deinococcus TaxID=1298 RepID=E8U6W2_DEIML|nr:cytochrome c assembly protein [Deinococcus maricopensis DSM 21211]
MGALGQLSLLVALAFALWGAALGVLGGVRGDARATGAARRASWAVFAFTTLALLVLQSSLLRDDFSVRYVAEHSMRASPTWVKVVTLWAALEGSILLWAWMLSLYAFVLSLTLRRDALAPWAMGAMFVSLIFFLGVDATIASPFTPLASIPADGAGPNPALQNHWMMAVHPVLLYLGFVGLAVPFAYAVAALVTGRLTSAWVTQTRRWTLVAWTFLTAAIVAGGWWSYETLGWGGYWAWDPVENASFIPWLLATAFLHSVQIQERRSLLKAWNVWLIVLAYATTVLGTFINRSGVVQSVHAFASGPVGAVFLGFLAFILVAGFALAAWRGPLLRDEDDAPSAVSREGAFLAANWLFLTFSVMVLLGTLFPVLVEAATGRKTSVGSPFFNAFGVPLGLGLLLLMGVGPLLPWRRAPGERLREALRVPVGAGVVAGVLAFALGARVPGVALTVALAAYNVAGLIVLTARATRTRGSFAALFPEQPRRMGAYLAHLGLVVLALGVAFSGAYKRSDEVTLRTGQNTTVLGHTLTLNGLSNETHPERRSLIADVRLDGANFRPRNNVYLQAGDQPFPTPAVRYAVLGDTYLVLTAADPQGGWASVRLIESPLVSWIWVGTLVIVAGAVLTLTPARVQRAAVQSVALPAD